MHTSCERKASTADSGHNDHNAVLYVPLKTCRHIICALSTCRHLSYDDDALVAKNNYIQVYTLCGVHV